jgi:DMSO reductase family type II enzyme heme b subunit
VGNPVAGPHDSPVQDLVAQGPGTLSPAPSSSSKGQGQHTENGWAVVIVRRLPNGLSAQSRSQVAFAVWEGAQREAGAVKMRTGWIPLSIQGKP